MPSWPGMLGDRGVKNGTGPKQVRAALQEIINPGHALPGNGHVGPAGHVKLLFIVKLDHDRDVVAKDGLIPHHIRAENLHVALLENGMHDQVAGTGRHFLGQVGFAHGHETRVPTFISKQN